MSSIYIQEPVTNGKVVLKSSVGDIDVELWSRECPLACRNFVQLCLEGYYDGSIFHRVVKGFIAQGGDPTNTGHGGESIYGKPFKDEFHQRLRFARRGLLAMAGGKPNNNESQFFFTLDTTPELEKKHTLFGKCVGDTVFNMLKLADGETDKNDRPLNPQKIISTEVVLNPFPDIVPREKKKREKKEKKKDKREKAEKNFNLLSFGDEAEEDEVELCGLFTDTSSKSKSAHDLAADEKLSAAPAVRPEEIGTGIETAEIVAEAEAEKARVKSTIREKLFKKVSMLKGNTEAEQSEMEKFEKEEKDEDLHYMVFTEAEVEEKRKVQSIKDEAKRLKKEIAKLKHKVDSERPHEIPEEQVSEIRKAYRNERSKYLASSKTSKAKDAIASREVDTLTLLERFKNRLHSAKKEKEEKQKNAKDQNKRLPASANSVIAEMEKQQKEEKLKLAAAVEEEKEQESRTGKNEAETLEEQMTAAEKFDVEDIPEENWLGHEFLPETEELRQAIDANMRTDEDYSIFDPRNAMNKRRRQADKELTNPKTKKTD